VRSIFVGSLQRGAAIHIAGIDVCVGTDYCKAIPGDWRRLDQANELRAWGCLTRCVAGRAVAERGNLSKTGRRIALTILKRASRPCRVVVGCSEAAMGFEQAAGCRLQLQTVRVRGASCWLQQQAMLWVEAVCRQHGSRWLQARWMQSSTSMSEIRSQKQARHGRSARHRLVGCGCRAVCGCIG
jgi:hypothetical protein